MTLRFYALALLAVLGMVPCCLRNEAAAQPPDSLVRDVVRLSFHESPDPLADAPGIHSVLVNGARERGVSTHSFAVSYAPRFFAGVSARPWFLELRLTCERPRGYVGRWRREVCEAVVSLVRSLREPVCSATAWGSVIDYRSGPHAAAHRHDVFVTCGNGAARNLFSHGGE